MKYSTNKFNSLSKSSGQNGKHGFNAWWHVYITEGCKWGQYHICGISICGILTLVSSSVLFLYLHVYIYQCVVFFRNLYWSLPTFCSSLIFAQGQEVSVSTCCGEPRGTPRDLEWRWKVLVTSNWKTFLQDLLKCLSLIMVGNIQYKTVYSWKYKKLCNVLLYTDTQQNKIFVWTSSLSS